MRNSILKGLTLVAALALLAPTAFAQDIVVETLFDFEGANGMGDVSGWVSVQDADTISTGSAPSDIKVVTEKAINGQGGTIPAFSNDYLLEATPNRGLRASTFRGAMYTWDQPQDWTNRSLLKLAASMNARNADAERHEYRIRVFSGSGASADTAVMVYEGLKSEEFDSVDNNTFVNEWEVLEFDLSDVDDFDLSQITAIEATGRNVDDGTENSPTTGNPTPGPNGNWGGNVHVDLVTIEGEDGNGTAADEAPGLRSLSQPYPNPATRRATLDLDVETAQQVSVRVVDVLGRTVLTAFDGTVGSTVELAIDTASLTAGTYVVLVQGETFAQSRRLTVVR